MDVIKLKKEIEDRYCQGKLHYRDKIMDLFTRKRAKTGLQRFRGRYRKEELK